VIGTRILAALGAYFAMILWVAESPRKPMA